MKNRVGGPKTGCLFGGCDSQGGWSTRVRVFHLQLHQVQRLRTRVQHSRSDPTVGLGKPIPVSKLVASARVGSCENLLESFPLNAPLKSRKKTISSVRRSDSTVRVVMDVFCFPKNLHLPDCSLKAIINSSCCMSDTTWFVIWDRMNDDDCPWPCCVESLLSSIIRRCSWCHVLHFVSLWKLRFINSAHRSLKKAPKRGGWTVRSSAIRMGLNMQELIEFLYDHVRCRSVHHVWDISMARAMGKVQRSKASDQGT